jgi:glycosyltransferase involved in cell wall biosynthesis
VSIEILIPYYGRFDYLQEAVESVLGQTDPNWKLTVVDDGFPGGEAAAYFETLKDSRVSYLRNQVNLGVTGNFNRCVQIAGQQHFVLMGFDDRLLPSFVAEAKTLIDQFPDAAIYQLGVEVIDSSGKRYFPLPDRIKNMIRPKPEAPIKLSSETAINSLMLGNWLYFPSVIWSAAEIKNFGFDPRFEIVQDLDLITKILLNGGELAISNSLCFQYRRHPASESSKAGGDARRYREEQQLFSELAPQLRSRGMKKGELRARLRITSRLAAAVDASKELSAGNWKSITPLLAVIFGR